MKVFIFNDDNGCMAIGTPCYQPEMTEQERDDFLIKAIEKSVPKKLDGSNRKVFIKIAEDLKIADIFIDAHVVDETDGSVVFDRSKAIEFKKNQFRYLRKPLFEKLDTEFMKALENNDFNALNAIKAQKQILRDITTIDMSQYQTPEDLFNFIPDILK